MRTRNFDRLLKVLHREEPDSPPIFELYLNPETMQVLTEGSPLTTEIDLGRSEDRRAYLEMAVKSYRKFGYDYVPIDVPTNFINGQLSKQVTPLHTPRGRGPS